MKSKTLRYEALEIFKTFTKKEISDFEHFLSLGQFVNTLGGRFTFGKSTERKRHSPKLIQFFKILKPFYPEFSELSNQYLMKKLGTKSPSIVKKHFAELKNLCEHFLVLQEISTDKYYYDESLLYQFQKRALNKLFDQKHSSVIANLNKSSENRVKDFYMRYTSGQIQFMRLAPYVKLRTQTDMDKVIQLQADPWLSFLFYFVFDSIKVIINLIAHSNSYNMKLEEIEMYKLFRQCFPNERLEHIIKKAIKLTPGKTAKKLIEIYWLIYLFRTTDSKEAGHYFSKFVNILESISSDLSLDERFDLFYERNFGFWIAMKYPEFEDVEFKMYELFFKNAAYKAAGKEKLSLVEFKNIIVRGDNTYRFDWTTNIMKKYLCEVEPPIQDMLLHYRNANVAFQRDKDFAKALEELRLIEQRAHYSMTRDILHMQICIYYELGYYESSLDCIESLRKFMTNQHIGAATADPFKRFIKCMKLLIKNAMNQSANVEEIFRITKDHKIVASKLWLKEKAAELERKYSTQHRRIASL